MLARTPDEWLSVLTARFDLRRASIDRRRSYVNGHAPLPEMSANTKQAWLNFQKEARTNYGGLATASLCNRIRVRSVTLGTDEGAPALKAARRIWRDNRMSVQFADATWDAASVGVGYLLTGLDEGGAVITAEKPEMAIAAPDPLRPWRARAFAKIWRDVDAGDDFAMVWAEGVRQGYRRPSYDPDPLHVGIRAQAAGGWTYGGAPAFYKGLPPVTILEWKDPRGFVAQHHDVIDRINRGKLQRLSATAMQAFKLRYLEGGLPKVDEKGNDIDWAPLFEFAPGALWDLPKDIKLSELGAYDITPMLLAEKSDARDFAAVSGTPISVFIPDAANQTAAGSDNAQNQQIFEAWDAIDRFKPAVEATMARALAAEGVALGDQVVDVQFAKPEHASMSEMYASAAQARAAGLSISTIERTILDFTPDQVAQDANERAEDAARVLRAPVAPPVVAPGPVEVPLP